jgi:hypothetical protein
MRKQITYIRMGQSTFVKYWNEGKPLMWMAAEAGGVHESAISKRAKKMGLKPRRPSVSSISSKNQSEEASRE